MMHSIGDKTRIAYAHWRWNTTKMPKRNHHPAEGPAVAVLPGAPALPFKRSGFPSRRRDCPNCPSTSKNSPEVIPAKNLERKMASNTPYTLKWGILATGGIAKSEHPSVPLHFNSP